MAENEIALLQRFAADGDADAFSQIVLAVTMTLGRLEVIALLTLVNFAHWRS